MRVVAALLLAIFGLSFTNVWSGPRLVQGSRIHRRRRNRIRTDRDPQKLEPINIAIVYMR